MGVLSDSILGKTQERALKTPLNTPNENSLSGFIAGDDSSQFGLAVQEGSKRNPVKSAEVINLKNSTGLPEDVVERNTDEITQRERQNKIDTNQFSKDNPGVTRWMAKSPNHAAAGYEDLTGLSYLERQIRNVKNQFNIGRQTVELSSIGESAFLGKATPQQRKRQLELESQQDKSSDYGITGFFEGIPGAIANQLPIMASTIGGQIKGALTGGAGGAAVGATGALIGGQLGPQAALPEEVVTVPGAALALGGKGALVGWRYGAGVQSARQEAALAYLDYEKLTDSQGRPIDRDVAKGAAAAVGVLNGAMEMVGFESIIKVVPGLRGLGRSEVRAALKNPTIKSAIWSYSKGIGAAMGGEGLTEFMQEMVSQSGAEITKMVAGGKPLSVDEFMGRIFSKQNIDQAIAAGRAGAQAGGGIAASAGAVSSTIDHRKAKAAQIKAKEIEKAGQVVESLNLQKTSPKSVEQIVDSITDGDDIYIPSDTFQTYWQEKGVDPKEVINEVLGNSEQFDNAVETGQDIVIPSSKYYTSPLLGAGENKAFFAQEVRTDPLEMNAREWKQEIQRLDEEQSGVVDVQPNAQENLIVGNESIRDAMKTKLTGAGFDNKTADSYAQLYESTFANLGERAGIDPAQLFERFNPNISRLDKEQTKTFLGRVTSNVRTLFQTSESKKLESKIRNDGVDLAMSERGDTITLSKIVVPESKRGQGIGTGAIQEIIDYADKNNKKIALTPSLDFGGSSLKRLNDFYARFGFIKNKGKNKDFSTRETLIREPKKIDKAITETQEFKKWFGKSKVVDDNGTPLVVYHGSNAIFDSFDVKKIGQTATSEGYGFYLTDNKEIAKGYQRDGGYLIEAYLSMQNPLDSKRKPFNSREISQVLNKMVDIEIRNFGDEISDYKDSFLSNFVDTYSLSKAQAIKETAQLIVDGNDTAIDQISELSNVVGDKTTVPEAVRDTLGFDGVEVKDFQDGEGTVYISWFPTQIKSVNNRGTFDPNDPRILFQDGVKKGSFRFGNGTFNIDLLEKADLSTFLHETGHFYLEMLGQLSKESNNDQIKSELKTITDWLGVDSFEKINTEHHEKFARGFEAYLMEGKSPSTALRRVFARFKVWLTNIYGTLKRLDVNLTDEVRGVFDRLLATDRQIQEVDGELNISPLFEDATILGKNSEKYKKAVDDFRMEVSERATSKLMKEYQREHKQWYKDELNNQRDIAKQELFEDRAYIVLTALQKGELPDGTPYSPETLPPKMDRRAVEKIIGKERTQSLPRGIFAKDGAHPDVLADLFQFRSEVELLEALEAVEKPKDRIERVAQERMKELYPNLEEQQEKFREEILKDVHNEKRSEILRFELKWLAEEAPTVLKDAIRRVSRRVPSNADVKAYAKNVIDKSTVSKIEPNIYLRAEKAAARDAGINLAKGDLDAAFEQKRIELINHELYKQAVEAREKIRTSLDNFQKIAIADKKLSKSRDIDLVNAARSVLAGYGIGVENERPESFLESMRQYDQETYNGIYPLIQSVLRSSNDYRSISYSDFQELNNVVQALWELSRSQKQMEIDGQKVDRDEVIGELTERISDISTPKERVGYTRAATKWEQTKMGILGIRAALRRVESWADAMDGGDPNGVFRKYIWNPISEAADQYRVQKKAFIQKYLDIVKTIEDRITFEKIMADELRYEFSDKAELLGAMLHTGNDSNLEKLLRGRGWGDFDDDGVLDRSRWDSFVKRMQDSGVLNKSDYDYLQAVWDLLEELKPAAQKSHKAMYGYYFSEVTATSFDTPFGDYRGGYVPAAVDPLVSNDQEIRIEREQLEGFNNSYMFPTTGRGFTKSRVQRYAAPLQMNLRFIPGHIDKVLRFVNIEPHVKDVGKIVMNRGFRDSLNEFDSGIAGDMLVPWLQRAATQQVETPSSSRGGRAADHFFREVRRRTGLNIMVGNVVNTLQQFTGLSIAAIKVNPRYLRNALWQYVRSPRLLSETVNEKSAFMSTRTTTNIMEIQGVIDDLISNQSKYEQARKSAAKHGYFMQAGTQNIVDLITWIGRYNQMIESGANEKSAIREADSAVRQTQGSFNAEDISRFETGSPFVRAFTMFYSYFNMQANLLGTEFSNTIRDIGLKKGAGRLLYVYLFGFMIPAVLSELLVRTMSGKYDDDDDDLYLDDTMNAFFGGQFRTATAMFPFAGPMVQAGINSFNDKWYDDRISTSPAVSMIESAVKAPNSVYKAIADEGNKKRAVRDTLSAVGLLTGLPAVLLSRPIGYWIDVEEENAEPTGPVDFVRGLVTGRSGQ